MTESFRDFDIVSILKNATIAYHQSCYVAYQLKKKPSIEEHIDSSSHKLGFESLCNFITKKIIDNNKDCEINVDDIQDYRTETL